jgi:hypothetical protein
VKRHPLDWAAIIAAVLALLGSVYIEATHTDRENATKISALESHRQDDNDRLGRIETKLDQLVDRLLGQKP